jgi:uncharacterized repeat protein (TIGR04138 family)
MQPSDFDDLLDRIRERDPRYSREAYHFLRVALDYTQKSVAKAAKGQLRHVTGKELLEGIRQHALAEFGPMSALVFEEWGVRRCEDFGEIVFNLVEHNILAKTEKDSREDFQGGYDFFDAFRRPFFPAAKRVVEPTQVPSDRVSPSPGPNKS